jgi:hypothetical protein
MRCPKCSYISFDDQVACAKCKLQLDGKNALPFQGTAIRAESIFFLRALPAAEEEPLYDPVAEEPYEDPTAALYRQLETEGMGAGLSGQSTEEELDLSLTDAGSDNESFLLDDIPQPTTAGFASEPAFELQDEEEIPSLELETEDEVHSLELPGGEEPSSLDLEPEVHSREPVAEEEPPPLDLEPEAEVHSLELMGEEEPSPLDLEPEAEVHYLEPMAEEEPFSLDLEPETEVHSLELQAEEESSPEDFSDSRPEIDDGEPGFDSAVTWTGPAAKSPELPGQEAAESAPVSREPAADLAESDLFSLANDEEPEQVEPNSFSSKSRLGTSIFDLSDLMGGESDASSADGPTIADNADMLLDLTFDAGTQGGVNEPGYDSRLTEEDELDLSLDLDDD